MPLLRKSRKTQAEATRRKRLGQQARGSDPQVKARVHNIILALAFSTVAILVCFAGLSPAGPVVREGQVARQRIVAEIPFTYTSNIRTEALLEERRQRVPPVYTLSLATFNRFAAYLRELNRRFTEYLDIPEGIESEILRVTEAEAAQFLAQLPEGNPFGFAAADIATLFNETSPTQRADALEEGLMILGDLYRGGIYDGSQTTLDDRGSALSFFNIQDESGRIREVEVQPIEEALRSLRINLSALEIPRDASVAMFRILRAGLEPNLVYDAGKTNELVRRAQDAVKPVQVRVEQGDVIVEPNARVSRLHFEQLEAYRRALRENSEFQFGLRALFIERIMMTLIIVAGCMLFMRLGNLEPERNRRTVHLSALIVIFNLLIARVLLELAANPAVAGHPMLVSMLTLLVPVALGPMIITILAGTRAGLVAIGVIGVFYAMMHGNSFAVLISTHLTGVVAIYFCRNIQLRGRVVRAGFYAGLVAALMALLIGIRDGVDPASLAWQMFISMLSGLFTGIAVVGLLPVFENLFRITTDITLLELTDFNHPLLRRMQLEAPGSYHHSLMVANLSENAAAAIGANSLVCRVCSLYHDIGKMVKPEYFTENQRDGYNPHIERNPSMSALVIKSHVKEGVQMARQSRLPEIIIDVIRQHHGTSLIQYFYYKALEKQQIMQSESAGPNAPRIELDKVNEDTYRYEGPRPDFIESAIIMLADAVEAAGRSLRKVTPQSIEELVQKIITARIEDGQLDKCGVTLEQLAAIRESFVFTSLNMLHSRVEYPSEPGGAASADARARKKVARKSTQAPLAEAAERYASQQTGNGEASPAESGATEPADAPRPDEAADATEGDTNKDNGNGPQR